MSTFSEVAHTDIPRPSTSLGTEEQSQEDERKRPRVLHAGCGSSILGVILQRDHGYDVVNADFSEVQTVAGHARPCSLEWVERRTDLVCTSEE